MGRGDPRNHITKPPGFAFGKTGGISHAFRFPHGFVLSESACRAIPQSKIKDFCQLPFTREPCGQCPLTISHGGFLRFLTSLARPVSAACQSPPCQRGVPRHRRGGGIPRHRLGTSSLITLHYSLKTPFPFPHRFVLSESACCESLSHAFGVPAPFRKGACGQCPLTISHGGFLRFLTSLTRPVSAACRRTYSLFTLHYSLNPPGIVTAVEIDARTKAPLPKGALVCFPSGNSEKRVAFAVRADYNRAVIVNNL